MRQSHADLFALHSRGLAIAVTTSGQLRRDGTAHLGAGCARECGRRFPWFAERLGTSIAMTGLRTVHLGERIIAFPVETTSFENPDLTLIARSARELVLLAQEHLWPEVALPRPGCGHGGLAWADVERVLAPILDNRFVVVTLPDAS